MALLCYRFGCTLSLHASKVQFTLRISIYSCAVMANALKVKIIEWRIDVAYDTDTHSLIALAFLFSFNSHFFSLPLITPTLSFMLCLLLVLSLSHLFDLCLN